MRHLVPLALALCVPGVAYTQAALAAVAPPAKRTDSIVPRTAARITGGESTTRVVVGQTRGADSLTPRLQAAAGDTAPILRKASRTCGPQRVCPAGWDVAAVGVRVPVPVVPTLVPVPARVGASFTVALPIPARLAGAVRKRECAVDYVSIANPEGGFDHPPPAVSIISNDAIVVEPKR